MLPHGHYYPNQTGHPEPVIMFVRRHWVTFVSWAILIFLMALAPILVRVFVLSNINLATESSTVRTLLIAGGSSYYLFTLAVFLAAWIDYYLDVTIVTEHRLVDIHQNGLFNHRVSEQSLLRVQDVTVRMQGPYQTFFQYGTVYVETAGEAPNFTMRNLPKPMHVANTIVELHNELIDQGLIGPDDTSNPSVRKLSIPDSH